MTSFVPVLVTLLGAAPTASRLAGCEAMPGFSGPNMWDYTCPAGLRATHLDEDRPRSEASKMLHQIVSDTQPQRTERWTVAGQPVEVIRVSGPASTVFFTVVPRAEGLRLLVCAAPDDAIPCASVFETLAQPPWRSGPAPGTKRVDRITA